MYTGHKEPGLSMILNCSACGVIYYIFKEIITTLQFVHNDYLVQLQENTFEIYIQTIHHSYSEILSMDYIPDNITPQNIPNIIDRFLNMKVFL